MFIIIIYSIDSHGGKEVIQCWVPMNPSWVLGFPWWEGTVTMSGSNEPKLGSRIPMVGRK